MQPAGKETIHHQPKRLLRHSDPWHQPAMTGLGAAMLSIMMVGVFALAAGGAFVLTKKRDRKRGLLMLAAAAVILANVLIWTL